MPMSRAIARKLTNYSSGRSVAYRLRQRRLRPLLEMIESVHRERGEVRILDIGGTVAYWRILPEGVLADTNTRITLVNLDEVPAILPPGFSARKADACELPFEAGSFDICHSNSVLEHVGNWERMRAFSREIARVAPRYFVQTPNFWFPVEPHCMTPIFHWLPRPWRVQLVRRFQLGHWDRMETVDQAVRAVERIQLIDRPMLQALFPQATIRTERFALLPNSLIALRDGSGAERAERAERVSGRGGAARRPAPPSAGS
jgi:hypothetical protein